LGGNVHTTKNNTETLLVASKNTGLEVNADKNKCMFRSRDQNAERNNNIQTDSEFSEGAEQFK
jgi:hypothetical protein